MSYTTEQAALLATQLERLATRGAHQIAGQFTNLGFWVDEAVHAITVIDEYPRRFRELRAAQAAWVSSNHTATLFCAQCGGRCELGPRAPAAPVRTSSAELEVARRDVRRACYRLLLRCHRVGLLDEVATRLACERIGATLEREDL